MSSLSNFRHFQHDGRLILTCVSIAANALSAGGIFIFPLLSPALALHLKLTQPQLTTIVLAGMMGQYPFAAVVGKIIDRYGPWLCSLISSALFSVGFGLFAWEIAKTPDDITKCSVSSFRRLAALFFMAGLGTVLSLFSSLFAASKNFPNYIGVASSASMALFGLSPLLLSLIASNFFSAPETGLDVTCFLKFMAIFAGTTHLIGAINLRTPKPLESEITPSQVSTSTDAEAIGEDNERTPLIAGKPRAEGSGPVEGSTLDLLKDPSFWCLALIALVTLGACEMIMSNIGTIVLSLPSGESTSNTSLPSTDVATSTQVRVLSIANTISRLLVGPVADYVSPVASYLPSGVWHFARKHHISRIAFLSGSTMLLTITFIWMNTAIRSQESVWMLSIGTGIVYGGTFTILPSIVSSVWGLSNLGRNFGILTYAPFIGTPLFSYFYAFVSSNHTQGGVVCKGVSCWESTFWVCSGAAFCAFLASLVLWRQWKGRV